MAVQLLKTNSKVVDRARKVAPKGAHLRVHGFIHGKHKTKRREVENNPRPIITVGFSWKRTVEASTEGVALSRSYTGWKSERAWAWRVMLCQVAGGGGPPERNQASRTLSALDCVAPANTALILLTSSIKVLINSRGQRQINIKSGVLM